MPATDRQSRRKVCEKGCGAPAIATGDFAYALPTTLDHVTQISRVSPLVWRRDADDGQDEALLIESLQN